MTLNVEGLYAYCLQLYHMIELPSDYHFSLKFSFVTYPYPQ